MKKNLSSDRPWNDQLILANQSPRSDYGWNPHLFDVLRINYAYEDKIYRQVLKENAFICNMNGA